jgi:ATP-dependent RNA helicase DeaD
MDGIDVSRLIEVIDDYAGVSKKDIGKIDLKGAYSFFEVETAKVEDVMKGLNGITYKGRQVRVELTEQKESSSKGSSGRSRDRGGRSSSSSSSSGRSGGGRSREKSSDRKKRW